MRINNQLNFWLMSKESVEQLRETEFFRPFRDQGKNSVSLHDFLT